MGDISKYNVVSRPHEGMKTKRAMKDLHRLGDAKCEMREPIKPT